jgi:excisionase family DNA binding protein
MTISEFTNADDLPLTLTIEEAAALLGIGRSSAYNAAARGDIPTLRLGRRLLVPSAKLLAMLGIEAGDDGDDGAGE